ncbi:MAG: ATP-binding protein, partial [Desulfobulbales bacterium]|nr:ATP-binding protein [Desulfobulbales bacterium]
NRDWLIACAGAAGPALEGGVARMGMRAQTGAIEHCAISPENGRLTYQTIGSEPARGICGSGVIDLVAGLYLARIIDIRGKFRPGQPQAEGRLLELEDGLAYVVVPAEETRNGKPILLSQVDIDALMRSKAAMYSILATITNQVGVSFQELSRIYVAGAFGKHIAPRQAIVLGMLPDLPLEVYQPLGNSSLAGAELILTDDAARERCRKVVAKVTYVELNVNQEFMIRFSGSRFIPHTDHTLFPSVPFHGDP